MSKVRTNDNKPNVINNNKPTATSKDSVAKINNGQQRGKITTTAPELPERKPRP